MNQDKKKRKSGAGRKKKYICETVHFTSRIPVDAKTEIKKMINLISSQYAVKK